MATSKPNVSGIGGAVYWSRNDGGGAQLDVPDATSALMDAIADEERKALQRKLAEADERLAEHVTEAREWGIACEEYVQKQEARIDALEQQLVQSEVQSKQLAAALDEAIKLHNAKVDENTALQAEMARNVAAYEADLLSHEREWHNLVADRDRNQLKARLQAAESAAVAVNTPKPTRLERFWRALKGERNGR